jgi:hypothetical protein
LPTLRRGGKGGDAIAGEHCYRVAGLPWLSSVSITALEAFSGAAAPAGNVDSFAGFPDAGVSATTEGWLAGAQRSVRADYSRGTCRVTVEGVGEFRVDPRRIEYPGPTATASPSVLVEALLGPALLLALAADGRFALHAGAAQVAGGGLWLFLGDSGAGKSTLAAAIGSNPGCLPVADDVLPVRWDGESLWALPWYPQLKLGDRGQYAGGGMPEHLPVFALCALAPGHARDPVAIERLSLLEATTVLIRQTVSARLFSPDLLARHLHDFARAATSIPLYRLQVPRDLGRLDEVYRTLRQTEAPRAPQGVAS